MANRLFICNYDASAIIAQASLPHVGNGLLKRAVYLYCCNLNYILCTYATADVITHPMNEILSCNLLPSPASVSVFQKLWNYLSRHGTVYTDGMLDGIVIEALPTSNGWSISHHWGVNKSSSTRKLARHADSLHIHQAKLNQPPHSSGEKS